MLETKSLKNVPIFAAGTWTASGGSKTKWTTAMLDQIVTNAKTLAKRVIPFLRIDHTDAKTQKRITGRFKIGDLENVRRVGKKLVVDIVRIPKKAYDLMEAGVFGRPSAEIWPTFKDEATGKNLSNVLSGAAVLSGEHPAVTTLDQIRDLFEMEPVPEWEIAAYEAEHDEAVCFSDLAFEEDTEAQKHSYVEKLPSGKWAVKEIRGAALDEDDTVMISVWESEEEARQEIKKRIRLYSESRQPSTGGDDVTKEEVTAMIEEANKVAFSKINEALGIEDDADAVKAIEELQSGKTALETQIADQEKKEFDAQIDTLLLDATKACKVTPALEPTLKASFAGKKIEEIKATLDGLPPIPGLKFEESGTEGDPEDGKGVKEKVSKVVSREVEEYSKRTGIPIDAESVEIAEHMQEFRKHNPTATAEEAYCEVTGSDPTPEPKTLDSGAKEA